MSLVLTRKKREEDFPLFDYRRLFSGYGINIRCEVFPEFSKHDFVICPIDYWEPFGRLRVPPTPRRVSLDDSESRIAIWRALFKDDALPMIEKGVVKKYAGSLDRYLPENVPVDKIIRHAKKG